MTFLAKMQAKEQCNTSELTASTATLNQFDLVYGFLGEIRKWHLTFKPLAWPIFDPDLVRNDIAEGRVFLFSKANDVVATFTLTESDPLVWEDVGVPPESYYMHRFATRRDHAGEGIGSLVLEWARDHSVARGKKYLRLDTWAASLELKAYYKDHGFALVNERSFPRDAPLPDHYRGTSISLFEMKLRDLAA